MKSFEQWKKDRSDSEFQNAIILTAWLLLSILIALIAA